MTKAEQKRIKTLGLKVKEIRLGKGLTLKELGNSIDTDFQSIYRLEQGKVNPSVLFLFKICEGLDVTLSELLKDF